MNMQPKKNFIIGNNDVYILDHQLLKDYVKCVYN
jgi:hypothetical protein